MKPNHVARNPRCTEPTISELLDDLIEAHDKYVAYLYREDHVMWTQKAEDDAAKAYYDIRKEIEDRCKR